MTAVRIVAGLAAWVAVLALLAGGCAKPEAAVDGAVFEKAIQAYLDSRSMGMKVAEFKHLKVTGDQAEAVASMQEAEGMVGAKVRWTFRFARDKSGAWTVTEHKQ